MIKVKNIGSSNLTIICPDLKFRRKLPAGREIPVAKDIYDELCYDTGFQAMVKYGMLKITGAEIEDAEVIETEYEALSADEIREIFEKKDITKLQLVQKLNLVIPVLQIVIDQQNTMKEMLSTLIQRMLKVEIVLQDGIELSIVVKLEQRIGLMELLILLVDVMQLIGLN